jgi:hypothetical protein
LLAGALLRAKPRPARVDRLGYALLMPDKRKHRGPGPEDRELFDASRLDTLRQAVRDYSWLLSRNYSVESSLKLVGDRYQLVSRQRRAVSRVSCSDAALAARRRRHVAAAELAGCSLHIDGFNACISMEVALSGGPLLVGRDGAYRDLASVHGSYRRVLETPRALQLLTQGLARCQPAVVVWYLDRPVSNSGTLARMLRDRFGALGLSWEVELVNDADRHVSAAQGIAVSADSAVLDASDAWFDVAGWSIGQELPEAWVVELAPAEAPF